MDIQTLTSFFMWCTIINMGILTLWTVFCVFTPELVYRLQSRFFPMPRETFNAIIYAFIGLFKVVILVFNVVPYIALLVIGT